MNINPTYQQELFRKYIDGSITEEERHALEKMALDDPFLFDALEGVHSEKEQSVSNIEEIQETIGSSQNEKSAKKRRLVPWQWMSIAAGIFLVTAIGFLIQPKQDMQWGKATAESASRLPSIDKYADYDDAGEEAISESQMADNKIDSAKINMDDSILQKAVTAISDKTDSADLIAMADVTRDQKELGSNARNKIISSEEIRALPTKTIEDLEATSSGLSTSEYDDISIRGSRGDATNIYVDGIRVSQSSIPKDSNKNQAETSSPAKDQDANNLEDMPTNAVMAKKKASKNKPTAQQDSKESDADMAEESMPQMIKITGQVTDESGSPLIGANVIQPNTNTGTMTDIDGKFALDISSSGRTTMIEIRYTGFATKSVPLDGSLTYDIIMEEGALLDEVMVSQNAGYKVLKSSLLKTRPIRGFDLFTSYVEENIILPDGCDGGTVTLSFTINTDGNLENVKVENASYPACSSEAIRLLKNGGKWVTTPPRQTVDTEYIMKMSY